MEADDEEYAGINVDNLATGYDDDFFLHIEDVFPPSMLQVFSLWTDSSEAHGKIGVFCVFRCY